MKLAIVVSHPIQHFCPQYASFAKLALCEVKVFFGSQLGNKSYVDPSFGKAVKWENLMLDSFPHVFLSSDVLKSDKNLDAENLDYELLAFHPDILISYGYFQKLQRRAQRWATQNDCVIALISDSELRRKRPGYLSFLKKIYLVNFYKQIDYFLTVGDANEQYYQCYQVPDRKFIRMPFPIDITYYEDVFKNKSSLKEAVIRALGIADDVMVCSVVGKVEEFKRQLDIVKAIEILGNAKVALLIVGTGPYDEVIKDYVKSKQLQNVHFVGFVPPAELGKIYATTDLYIHPSEKDAHSLAISEAVYMGCPVLLSDRCGSYGSMDDVQIGKNGFVFPTSNVEELSRGIQYFLDNPNVRRRFSEYSRNTGVINQRAAHALGLTALLENVKYNRGLLTN